MDAFRGRHGGIMDDGGADVQLLGAWGTMPS
jgi:hypothetical protein